MRQWNLFVNVPYLHRKIKTLQDVGLGDATLGQSAVTLSGGEAQRVKLATELSKRDTGQTIYILRRTHHTGRAFRRHLKHLLSVLNRLVDRGNTIPGHPAQ
jgi:excinuclease ABC subunit A